MKLWLKYALFLGFFAILGFSREFLFVNINSQLYRLYYGHSNLPLPESLYFLNNFDFNTLYYLKFPLTILFFFIYLITSVFSVRTLSGNKKYGIWVIYIYALLLILASLTMAYNYFINKDLGGDEYTFSRWLMGIAQSPLVAFFIIAAGALYKKFQPETK